MSSTFPSQDIPDNNERAELLKTVLGNLNRLISEYESAKFDKEKILDEIFILNGSNQLRYNREEFEKYFATSLEEAFTNLKNIVLGLLTSIREFINENQNSIDESVLRNFNKTGITSHAIDIRRFPTEELIEEAKRNEEQTDMQGDRPLNLSLENFTHITLNFDRLANTLKADPAKSMLLLNLFLAPMPNEDLFSTEALLASYKKFKVIMEGMGSKATERDSISDLTEYLLAIHLFSDAITAGDHRLSDALSNIFVRLEYLLMGISMEIDAASINNEDKNEADENN